MFALLKYLWSLVRSLSWGQQGYALILLSAVGLFGYAGINAWRARSYDDLHKQVAAAGAKSTRNVTILSDPEEAYFMALQGDLSAVAMNGVIGSGPDCTIDATLLRRMSSFPEITTLRLTRVPLKPEDYQSIYGLENLTRLTLSHNELTDSDLAGIERLENLESLELQFTSITDASVPRLAMLQALATLDITGTDISPAGAERLRQAYRIIHGAAQPTKVRYRQSPSSRYRAAVIRLLPTNAYRAYNGGISLNLNRQSWKSREQDLPLIAELTDVDAVFIQRMPLTPSLLDSVASLPHVQQVQIYETSTAGRDLSKLAANPKLGSLRLVGMVLDEAFVSSLGKLESLETLVVQDSKFLPGAALRLAEIPSLRSLHLRDLEFDAAEFSQCCDKLGSAPQLRMLEVVGVPLDNESLPQLGRLKQLISLAIGQIEVDDGAVPELCKFTHLRQLDIRGCGITQIGAMQLEAALLPGKTRVVHPRSAQSTFSLNLVDLVASVEAEATSGIGSQRPDSAP
jgi:Leucine-rich repeat (LRR) protein